MSCLQVGLRVTIMARVIVPGQISAREPNFAVDKIVGPSEVQTAHSDSSED